MDYSATSTVNGFDGAPTYNIYYKVVKGRVFCDFYMTGDGNGTAVNFTLPYSQLNLTNLVAVGSPGDGMDADTDLDIPLKIWCNQNSNIIGIQKDYAGTEWTDSGTTDRTVRGSINYPIN